MKTSTTPTHPTAPERGAASILVSLQDSTITIQHGTDGAELTSPRNVRAGYWDALFDLLENPERVYAAALAPEMAEALAALLAADEAICEDIGSKSDQAMQRIAALDNARAILARVKGGAQ